MTKIPDGATALTAKDAELAGALGASERFSVAWRDAERRAERAEAELAEAKEELDVLRAIQTAHVEVRARLTTQLAETRKALKAIEKEAKKNKPNPDKIWDIARRALEGGNND